jgi:cephalosporin-C deacetylase
MPLTDMPLAELVKYQGRNERPDDFDDYWRDALRDLAAQPDELEIKPAEFTAPQAEAFDLRFTGVGGARIYAKYLRPKNRQGRLPTILHFHGYTGNTGDWFDKLAWVGQGFCVAAIDCRGQGGKSEDLGGIRGPTYHGHIVRGIDDPSPKNMLFRNIFLDCAQIARIVMGFDEVDPKRVASIGASQGGALSLVCAALEPRIARAVSVYPFLSDYRRVWDMDLCKDAYAELKSYFRWFDPRHEREAEIFRRLGYIDTQHLANRIRAKTLVFACLADTVCPPSTVYAVYNKITSAKEMVVYPDYGHEHLPGWFDRAFGFLAPLQQAAKAKKA